MTLFAPTRFRLAVVDECGSTNEVLLGLRAAPDFHGRALLALRQTAGRGRRGRSWDSGAGNLALSLALRHEGDTAQLPLLPFLAGIALFEQVSRHLPPGGDLRLKWPNDLYLNGRKLAGMLAQARQAPGGTDVVLGLGVNLAHAPDGMNATSLVEAGGAAPDPESFALGLLMRFEAALAGVEDFARLREEWERRARLHDGALYVVGEPAPLKGRELCATGELLVENERGEPRTLASEDVSLRYQPSV